MYKFLENNMYFEDKGKKYLNKKKIVFMSFFFIVFIAAIILTFYLMKVNIWELFTTLKNSYEKSPLLILYIFLILLYPIIKGFGTIMAVQPKLKDMGIKISWYEYATLYTKLFVLNCITPFATGSEPYLIYWVSTRAKSIKTGNLISLINGIGGNIAETLITIPSFIVVSMHYSTLTSTLNGMIVYWFIVGGLCVNIFVLSFFIALSFSKKMHYTISRCSNWILMKLKKPHLTKEEIYQKYIVEAEFRKMVVQVFKDKKYIILSALGYSLYSIYFYITMIFSFMIGSGEYNFFNNSNVFFGFFNIANVSITASNFIPVPNGEGTIPIALSVLLTNFFDSSNTLVSLNNSIRISVLEWRLFTTYVPLIFFILVCLFYYCTKLYYIKKHDKLILMKQQEINRNNISFSFIIPLYNCENYICETIDSILNNGYDKEKIQIVVVDDGSTDNSLNAIKKYKKDIEVHKKPNGNWGSVINYAIKNIKLTGDYISVLDADDILEPNALTLVSECPRTDIIIGNFNEWTTKKKKQWKIMWGGSRHITNINEARTPYCHPVGKFYKKEVFLKAPLLREKISYQDGHLFHGTLNNANDVYYLNKTLASWRSDREGNSTSQEWSERKAEQFAIHFQDVSDAGSLSIVLITCISSSIRKPICKYNLKIERKDSQINYDWFPKIIVPFVKMVVGIMGIKKKILK